MVNTKTIEKEILIPIWRDIIILVIVGMIFLTISFLFASIVNLGLELIFRVGLGIYAFLLIAWFLGFVYGVIFEEE